AIAKALDGRLNLRPHPLSDPVKQRLVELDSDAVIVEANPVFFTAERPGNALLDHLPVYDGPVIDKARQHVVGGKLGLVGDVAHADHVRLGAGSEHRDADAVAALPQPVRPRLDLPQCGVLRPVYIVEVTHKVGEHRHVGVDGLRAEDEADVPPVNLGHVHAADRANYVAFGAQPGED